MSEPLEVGCDAPRYAVVKACQSLGFRRPLDVRWHRMSHFLASKPNLPSLWSLFFARKQSSERTCTCGEPLPALENYTFTFASERVIDYRLGQCRRCATMFWEA